MADRRLRLADGLTEALATVRANPLRSSLAALAMAAAVATTAIVVTTLDGLAARARETSARAFGTDSFVIAKVFGAGLNRRELADELARNPDLDRSDLRFLDRYAGGDVRYSVVSQRSADVVAGGRTFENASLNGTNFTLADIRDVGLGGGRFFSREEDQRAAQVAVIGWEVANALFPTRDPLGASVRIGGRGFTVIGVQTRQGTAGGVSLDRYVWIPVRAYERIFGAPGSLQIFARASHGDPTTAEDRARVTMRARHHLGPGEADDFDLLTPEAGRSFVETITERIGAAGPPISLMALLAAIIVVANTTLVSVTQRTREIGVRRALGATRAQVIVEVLAESGVVAAGGGAIGLAGAALAIAAASRIAGLPLSLGGATAAGSLLAAAASGVAAGWYPARRAAGADIVAALRAE